MAEQSIEYKFMLAAMQAAEACYKQYKEHPIGAAVVRDGQLVAVSGNRCHQDNNPLHHAESVVITESCKILGTRRLEGCDLYTTHNPCPTCAWNTVTARMDRVISGTGTADVLYMLSPNEFRLQDTNIAEIFNRGQGGDHQVDFLEGVFQFECRRLLLLCQRQMHLPFSGYPNNLIQTGDWLLTPEESDTLEFMESDFGISLSQVAAFKNAESLR